MDVGGEKELGRDTEILWRWTGKNQWSFETMGVLGFKRKKSPYDFRQLDKHSEDYNGFLLTGLMLRYESPFSPAPYHMMQAIIVPLISQ